VLDQPLPVHIEDGDQRRQRQRAHDRHPALAPPQELVVAAGLVVGQAPEDALELGEAQAIAGAAADDDDQQRGDEADDHDASLTTSAITALSTSAAATATMPRSRRAAARS
jgi:hypothetical protein